MGLFSSTKSKLSKSDSDATSHPPGYNDAAGSSYSDDFVATGQLQVHAIGYDTNQSITSRTLENIDVFRSGSSQPEYTSVRLAKNSNSCALVRASAPQSTLISTIYRFGPGRHPRMRIMPPNSNVSVAEAIENDSVSGEVVEVKSRSLVSRGQVFDTSLGKFEWRYANKEEQAACNADSLLILERTDRVSLPSGDKSKSGVRVAQLIRNDQFRTPGTVKYSGGNGGCLMVDLRLWSDDKHVSTQSVEAFIVASCILMLKREADRFIDNNLAAVT